MLADPKLARGWLATAPSCLQLDHELCHAVLVSGADAHGPGLWRSRAKDAVDVLPFGFEPAAIADVAEPASQRIESGDRDRRPRRRGRYRPNGGNP